MFHGDFKSHIAMLFYSDFESQIATLKEVLDLTPKAKSGEEVALPESYKVAGPCK